MNNGDMHISMSEYLSVSSDGTVIWKKDKGTAKKGDVSGSETCRGYRQLKFMGKRYLCHRVVFFLTHGFVPPILDHIDGDTKNNKPINLRAATHSQNMINRKHHKNNKSGHKGVDWMPRHKVWRAQIHKNGEKIYLGVFKKIEDAIEIRQKAEKKYHGEFTRK